MRRVVAVGGTSGSAAQGAAEAAAEGASPARKPEATGPDLSGPAGDKKKKEGEDNSGLGKGSAIPSFALMASDRAVTSGSSDPDRSLASSSAV